MSSLAIAHVSNEIAGGMGVVFRILLPAQVKGGDRVAFFVRHAEAADLAHFAAHGVEMRHISGTLNLARQLRGYDVVHLHSANLDLLIAGWLSRRATIFTLHGLRAQTRGISTMSVPRPPTLRGLRRRLKRFSLSFMLRHAVTRVATVSQFLAGKASSLYGVDRRKVMVVPNGIALDTFRGCAQPPSGEATVIGWMGRLVPVKRVDILLRTVARLLEGGRHRELRVVILGDGPLRDELMALARSLGIDNVVDFVGHTDEPARYLAQMHVLVFPSENEGAGNVVNEAMAAGVPVVVLKDGGGAAELVNVSSGGIVVDSEALLADAVEGLLADGDLRSQLSRQGLSYALRELDPAAWADRYRTVYQAARGVSGR